MSLSKIINESINENENWVLRRQKNIPNNRSLFVLTCMDERIPIEEVLGLELGDAHIFRNAGGLVTDDVIRSAALTLNFFGTKEIIVVNHTECGMMSAHNHDIVKGLEESLSIKLNNISLDPAFPELIVDNPDSIGNWFRTFENIDETTLAQVEFLCNHPLIPKDTIINGYIYEVETNRLRRPHEILSNRVNSRKELLEKGTN